jgi:hypothetical protein
MVDQLVLKMELMMVYGMGNSRECRMVELQVLMKELMMVYRLEN